MAIEGEIYPTFVICKANLLTCAVLVVLSMMRWKVARSKLQSCKVSTGVHVAKRKEPCPPIQVIRDGCRGINHLLGINLKDHGDPTDVQFSTHAITEILRIQYTDFFECSPVHMHPTQVLASRESSVAARES
jgi:hypothetical protein